MKTVIKEKARKMLKDPDNLVIVTHKNCSDGNGVVMAFAKLLDIYPSELDVVYMHYGDSVKKLTSRIVGKNVFMGDFSLPKAEMLALNASAKDFVCVDHHKTARANLKDLNFTYFNMDRSGAMLTWQALSDEEPPILIKYIEDRDLWNWRLPDSHAVNALAGIYKNNIDRQYIYIDNINSMIVDGKLLLLKDQQVIDGIMKRLPSGRFIELAGHKIPIINTTTLISEIGNAVAKKYPFALMYFFTEDKIIFSLRSNDLDSNSIDVEVIARLFNGGGHEHAAGFSFKTKDFDFDAFYMDDKIRKKSICIFTPLVRFFTRAGRCDDR